MAVMIYRGTFTEMLLKCLLYKTHSFKRVEQIVRKHREYKNISNDSIRSTLTRLKKKKLVARTSAGWSASNLALATLGNRAEFNKISHQTHSIKRDGEIIVMYDVPENLRQKRDRLREALEILDFKQKQKSVWIGSAPLPREFIKYLGELGLLKYVNFFRIKKEDIVLKFKNQRI